MINKKNILILYILSETLSGVGIEDRDVYTP